MINLPRHSQIALPIKLASHQQVNTRYRLLVISTLNCKLREYLFQPQTRNLITDR
jgi:hypothetical protein